MSEMWCWCSRFTLFIQQTKSRSANNRQTKPVWPPKCYSANISESIWSEIWYSYSRKSKMWKCGPSKLLCTQSHIQNLNNTELNRLKAIIICYIIFSPKGLIPGFPATHGVYVHVLIVASTLAGRLSRQIWVLPKQRNMFTHFTVSYWVMYLEKIVS